MRRHLMIPNRITVVVSFEGSVRFSGVHGGSEAVGSSDVLVVGPHSDAMVAEYDSQLRGMSVVLEPWLVFTLAKVSMTRLANSVLPASEVFGADAFHLKRLLAAAPSWLERFARIEAFLAERFSNGSPYSPFVAEAWRELCRSDGVVSIEELAAGIGWSRRNLGRRFREQIGLSPKAVARTLRLRRACQLLLSGLPTADVALKCQYYDQAHFVHDFKSLTELTPKEFLAEHAVNDDSECGEDCQPAMFSGLIT